MILSFSFSFFARGYVFCLSPFRSIRQGIFGSHLTRLFSNQVTCFTYEGIEAIKPALQAGLDKGSEQDETVKIQLFTTPLYLMFVTTPDPAHGIQTLENMIAAVREKIEASGGTLTVKAEVTFFDYC